MIVKLTETKLRSLIRRALNEGHTEGLLAAADFYADREGSQEMIPVEQELEDLSKQLNVMLTYYKQNPEKYDDLVKSDVYTLKNKIENLKTAMKNLQTEITKSQMTSKTQRRPWPSTPYAYDE